MIRSIPFYSNLVAASNQHSNFYPCSTQFCHRFIAQLQRKSPNLSISCYVFLYFRWSFLIRAFYHLGSLDEKGKTSATSGLCNFHRSLTFTDDLFGSHRGRQMDWLHEDALCISLWYHWVPANQPHCLLGKCLSTGIPSPGLQPFSPIPEGNSRELEQGGFFDCRREAPALLLHLIPTPMSTMALQASKMPWHPVFAGCRQVPWGKAAVDWECNQIALWRSLLEKKTSVWDWERNRAQEKVSQVTLT